MNRNPRIIDLELGSNLNRRGERREFCCHCSLVLLCRAHSFATNGTKFALPSDLPRRRKEHVGERPSNSLVRVASSPPHQRHPARPPLLA